MRIIKKIILVLLLLINFVDTLIVLILKFGTDELAYALPQPMSAIILFATPIVTTTYLLIKVCQKENK